MEIERLPVIALRNMVFFPGGTMPVIVGREKTVNAVFKAQEEGQRVFLTAQKRVDGHAEAANLYRKGTIGAIENIIRLPNGILKVVIRGEERGEVLRFSTNPSFVEAWVDPIPVRMSNPDRVDAVFRRIVDGFKQFVSLSDDIPEDIIKGIQLKKPAPMELINLVIMHVKPSYEQVQNVLEQDDIEEMLKMTLELLLTEVEIERFKAEVDDRVQEKMGETQKNHILRQKLHAIQEELGEDSYFQQEIDKYQERMKKKHLPQEAQATLERELTRLSRMHPVSAEATVSRTYIEWILDLPWQEFSEDQKELSDAWGILDHDHYNLKDVKRRIVEHLALVRHTGSMKGPILCLVGPPGVGKTSLGRSIARAMDRKFVRISLGGIDDESEIRGHRRTYIGALPGKIIQSLKKAGTSNPVFLLDEVDKLGKSIQGDPASALLEVLDPEQNSTFMDTYLELEYDLSNVMFITTANTTYGIPEPLMDRMELLRIPGYTEYEKEMIARNFLIQKALKEHGIEEHSIQFSQEIIRTIIREYTHEAGVRQLEREIQKIMRSFVHDLVDKGKPPFSRLTENRLRKILGVSKSRMDSIPDELGAGASIGLAWTQGGGDALLIEAVLTGGSGRLELTGSLGDVMQESARAAYSFVKAIGKKIGLDYKQFEKKNLHIHIPGGAVPKDGPSAGVTLAMAIISAFTGQTFPRNTAITGEISLSGRVLPVGGLPEKLIAARAYGMKRVFVPAGNREDIEDMDEKITDGLDIVFSDSAETVMRQVFPDIAK